jgi:hypothetical protein
VSRTIPAGEHDKNQVVTIATINFSAEPTLLMARLDTPDQNGHWAEAHPLTRPVGSRNTA